jgi:hypothetical protein
LDVLVSAIKSARGGGSAGGGGGGGGGGSGDWVMDAEAEEAEDEWSRLSGARPPALLFGGDVPSLDEVGRDKAWR